MGAKSISKFLARTEGIEPPQPPGEQFMFVNTNRRYVKVPFAEVLYVESMKDYVSIQLPEQRILTKDKIRDFEQKPPKYFFRVHRCYLVNTQRITACTTQDVEIEGKEIPIGGHYKRAVLDFLQ